MLLILDVTPDARVKSRSINYVDDQSTLKKNNLKLHYVPDYVQFGQTTVPAWASSVFGSR